MTETNESEIENVKADLASPVPDKPVAKTKEKTKVATKKKVAAPQKAAPKKVTKTNGKAEAPAKKETKVREPADENTVTLAQLAAEAEISGQTARQKIRATDLERDGRWAWRKGSRELATARKALGLAAK